MLNPLAFPSQKSHHIAYQVGVLCIGWSSLESVLNALVAHYLKVGDVQKNEILAGELDIRKKVKLIKSLGFLQEPRDRLIVSHHVV